MAELERKIIVSNAEMRPCVVKGEKGDHKALFHRWSDTSSIIPPSPMVGGHGGGEVRRTLAIVEFEDGNVAEISPEYIRFLDRNKEKAEFACRVCFEKLKKDNPKAIDCAWRGLDNEYCPELKKILEREDNNK